MLKRTIGQGQPGRMTETGPKSTAVEVLAVEERRIEQGQLRMSVAGGHSSEGRVERNFGLLGPEEHIAGALVRRRGLLLARRQALGHKQELLVRRQALGHKRELLVRYRTTEQQVLRHS